MVLYISKPFLYCTFT